MRHLLIPFCLLMLSSSILPAQNSTETDVKTVISTLFDYMKLGDTAKMRALFDPSCRLQTAATNKEGKPVLENAAILDWLKGVAGAKTRGTVIDEKILSYEVRIDDNLATVWAPYELHVNGKFNHCGVDAFQLYKSEQGWKIIQVCDTRRKDRCQK